MKIEAARPLRAEGWKLTSLTSAVFYSEASLDSIRGQITLPLDGSRGNADCKRACEMGFVCSAIFGDRAHQGCLLTHPECTRELQMRNWAVSLGYAFPRGVSVPTLGMFHFHSPFQFCTIPKAFLGHLLCSDIYGAPTMYAGLSAEDRGMKLS